MTARAGLLRTPIVIRRGVQVQNAKGGFETDWTTIASPRARVEGLDGREIMIAAALQGISSYRITIRWRNDVLPSDQIQLPGGREINIASVSDPDGRQRWLVILADTGSVRSE